MRKYLLLAAATFAAATALTVGAPAQASSNLPFCARLLGQENIFECDYYTWEQCQERVSGNGFCDYNPAYAAASREYGRPVEPRRLRRPVANGF